MNTMLFSSIVSSKIEFPHLLEEEEEEVLFISQKLRFDRKDT